MVKLGTVMLLAVAMAAGCSSNGGAKDGTSAKTAGPVPKLYLSSVDFAGDLEVEKLKLECQMLPRLVSSILTAAEQQLTIIQPAAGTAVPAGEYELRATYTHVVANKWRFPSIRPGSIATVSVTLFKDGQALDTYQKELASNVAVGACDRLEKIANTGGQQIVAWAAKYDYQ